MIYAGLFSCEYIKMKSNFAEGIQIIGPGVC